MVKTVVVRIVICILVLLMVISALLLLYRESKKQEIRSQSTEIVEKGGISEHRKININGLEQHLVVEGQRKNAPVLLFLHGGPGTPVPFGASSRGLYPELTKEATVVYWDQRGAGKSYKGTQAKDLTVEQMVEDTLAVTRYLKKEFKQEKICLSGVSWGTIPGLLAVSRAPELYHAYYPYAQATRQDGADTIVYNWLLGKHQDPDMEVLKTTEQDKKTLAEMGPPPFTKEQDDKFSEISDRTLGKNEHPAKMSNFLLPIFFSPDYSLSEIYTTIFKGSELNMQKSNLVNEVLALNLSEEITEIEVPITFFNGRYDKVVPVSQVREFMEKLKAPKKELVFAEHSGHMPNSDDMKYVMKQMASKIKQQEEALE